jgi:hypothetical protein
MKKSILILAALLLGTFTSYPANHAADRPYTYDGNAYIFIEGPIEFSVFPDGQFDFVYLGYDNRGRLNVNINTANVNINYNSGYNYDPYLQYDDYGAVIQIEEVPIYYDQFGRITRAGNTNIVYHDRRIVRVGGLQIFYHPWGGFNYCTGYINFWTPRYIWRPWHVYYMRPYYTNCIVYDLPYRRFYNPHRYPYWRHRALYNNGRRVAYTNGRRDFSRPGSRIHYRDGRTAINRNFNASRRNPIAAANPRKGDNSSFVERRGKSKNAATAYRAENSLNDRISRSGKDRKTPVTVSRPGSQSRPAAGTRGINQKRDRATVDRKPVNRTTATSYNINKDKQRAVSSRSSVARTDSRPRTIERSHSQNSRPKSNVARKNQQQRPTGNTNNRSVRTSRRGM